MRREREKREEREGEAEREEDGRNLKRGGEVVKREEAYLKRPGLSPAMEVQWVSFVIVDTFTPSDMATDAV